MPSLSQLCLRTAGAIIVAGGLGLAGGAAAQAATYPPTAPICGVTPNPAPAGGTVTLTGTGFAANTPITITSSGSGRVTNPGTVSDAAGSTNVLEAVTTAGSAVFTLSGAGGGGTCQVTATVAAPPPVGKTTTQVGKVSAATLVQGESVVFSGCGYKPGTSVTITDTAGHSYGSAPVGSDGCFSKKIFMNTPGDYTLVGRGIGRAGEVLITTAHIHVEGLTDSRAADVVAGDPASGGNSGVGGLAFTGADGIGTMLLVGGGLVGAGSGFLARGRRRALIRG